MVVSYRRPQEGKKAERAIGMDELIDRMATELRAKSDPEFPHSYYVEQVRRRLAGKPALAPAANDGVVQAKFPTVAPPSVFHAWALSE